MKTIRLTGHNLGVTFSADGSLIAVAGYDGSVKIRDSSSQRWIFRSKLRGPRAQLPIYHHAISRNNRYYAFSCLRSIFVVDLTTGSIYEPIPVSPDERSYSTPFVFNHHGDALIIPNGRALQYYTIQEQTAQSIPIDAQAGWSNAIAIDPTDRYIAYKSNNPALCDTVLVLDLHSGIQQRIPTPYTYIPGRQMFQALLQFVQIPNTLAVLRKSVGLSFYDYQTGAELRTIPFEALGGRSVFHFNQSKISADGTRLLLNTEDAEGRSLEDWSFRVPDGLRYVLYDLNTLSAVFQHQNGEGGADFHGASNQIAFVHWDYGATKRTESLQIFDLTPAS